MDHPRFGQSPDYDNEDSQLPEFIDEYETLVKFERERLESLLEGLEELEGEEGKERDSLIDELDKGMAFDMEGRHRATMYHMVHGNSVAAGSAEERGGSEEKKGMSKNDRRKWLRWLQEIFWPKK